MSLLNKNEIKSIVSDNLKQFIKNPVILVLFLAIFSIIFFISISVYTYQESNHVEFKNLNVVILGTIKTSLPKDNIITISVKNHEKFKKIINENITCELKSNILNKEFTVDFVEYQYKDFFREGNHIRIIGLKEKICKV